MYFCLCIPGLVGNRFLIDFQAQDFVLLSFRISLLVPPSTHLRSTCFWTYMSIFFCLFFAGHRPWISFSVGNISLRAGGEIVVSVYVHACVPTGEREIHAQTSSTHTCMHIHISAPVYICMYMISLRQQLGKLELLTWWIWEPGLWIVDLDVVLWYWEVFSDN